MAKQSLKKRIDALVNALGAAEKPSSAQIRNELVALAHDAEKLEDGQALGEKDARISDLEATLEKSDVQLGNLKVLLEEAGDELKAFRTEQKKREEKDREIDPIQFQILERLGSPATCDWLNLGQIAHDLKIPVDEAEIYIEGLDGLGLVFYHPHEPGGGGWLRTAEGNKLVVAKRWAGETEEKKQRKYADLPERQHAVLVALGTDLDGLTEETIAEKAGLELPRTIRALRLLQKAGMATDGGSDAVVFADGALWSILERGEEYLEERDLL